MHKVVLLAIALGLAMMTAACADSSRSGSQSAAVHPINRQLVTPLDTVGSTVGTGTTLPDLAGGRGGR